MGGLRVLLVDDDSINRIVLKRRLLELGCEVVAVENGARALDALESASFGLILMDLHMPVLDGLQAAREIRRRGCKGRLLALTADCYAEARQEALAAGFQGVVQKPLDLNELARILAESSSE